MDTDLDRLIGEWQIENSVKVIGRQHYPDLDGETLRALATLQGSGIDIYSQLGFDRRGVLKVNEPVPGRGYLTVGAEFGRKINRRVMLKHNIYRVPLLFRPEALDRDSFSTLDQFLGKLRPRPKSRPLTIGDQPDDTAGIEWDRKWRSKWGDDHGKLMRFGPRQWLERQMLDVLLFTLDVICNKLFWRYWRAMANTRRVKKDVGMLSEIQITNTEFEIALPRPTTPDGEKKARLYETARLVLIDLGVIRVNPSYEVGERSMGYNLKTLYRRPIFKFLAIERPRARTKPKVTVPAGEIEQFVQRNLQELGVDARAWGEMVVSDSSNPERLTLCVDA